MDQWKKQVETMVIFISFLKKHPKTADSRTKNKMSAEFYQLRCPIFGRMDIFHAVDFFLRCFLSVKNSNRWWVLGPQELQALNSAHGLVWFLCGICHLALDSALAFF